MEIGDRSKWTYFRLAQRLEKKYNIDYLCTDYYSAYSCFKISNKHIQSKAETSLVEAKNSIVRHYLARFHRRTKRFSKSLDMIYHSLRLLFNRDMLDYLLVY